MSIDAPETRDRILKTARRLLEAREGKPVSMSEVASESGLTRQAVYLHFSNKVELLIAVTHYIDEEYGSDARLSASRAAKTGLERLDAYVEAWCNYIPEIYGVAHALMAMSGVDLAAATTWKKRMQDMWEGCAAAVKALKRDGDLAPDYSVRQASDQLWMLLSIRNWEALCLDRGWSQKQFVAAQLRAARRVLVRN